MEAPVTATELFQKGQLQEAIDAQVQAVKAKPGDQSTRLFLFELLAFSGDLDRAQKQIDVLKYDEMELEVAAQNYRNLLVSERLRRRVFDEGIAPEFLGEAPEHVKLRLEALQQLRGNDIAAAKATLAKAEAAVPAIKGSLNEKPFALLRDCDDLFGPTLEVMARGKYLWIGLDQVDQLAMNPPKFPRDLIWFPANLQMRDGQTGEVFLPLLYPGSHTSPDPQVKLGRMTDWVSSGDGPVRGIGARTFLVDDDATDMHAWRQVILSE
jgi:type VI secretion system protein ImpE